MIASMDVLRQYSARTLSFDADALNAIIGAMNSYARYGVQHIWGVPWKRSSADYSPGLKDFLSTSRSVRRDIDIALLWNHWKPSIRRNGFPSWSPLGWKTPIQWFFVGSLHGPYVTPEATIVRVKSNKDFHKLYALANPEESSPEELSQYLKVEARTAMCNLQFRTARIRISLGNGWDAIVEVHWDLPPDKGNEKLLKCVLLPGADFTKSTVNELSAQVLILEQHENHYERIGMTRLPARFGKRKDCVLPFFCLQNEFGRVYGPDDELPSDVEKDIQSAVMVEYWWWKHFEPETIILG
ncbi:hypothetical protein J4E91_009120 [Alternaria rosae]|nr:hypothetical protein J4E91_009120 [Alternaria rosae]